MIRLLFTILVSFVPLLSFAGSITGLTYVNKPGESLSDLSSIDPLEVEELASLHKCPKVKAVKPKKCNTKTLLRKSKSPEVNIYYEIHSAPQAIENTKKLIQDANSKNSLLFLEGVTESKDAVKFSVKSLNKNLTVDNVFGAESANQLNFVHYAALQDDLARIAYSRASVEDISAEGKGAELVSKELVYNKKVFIRNLCVVMSQNKLLRKHVISKTARDIKLRSQAKSSDSDKSSEKISIVTLGLFKALPENKIYHTLATTIDSRKNQTPQQRLKFCSNLDASWMKSKGSIDFSSNYGKKASKYVTKIVNSLHANRLQTQAYWGGHSEMAQRDYRKMIGLDSVLTKIMENSREDRLVDLMVAQDLVESMLSLAFDYKDEKDLKRKLANSSLDELVEFSSYDNQLVCERNLHMSQQIINSLCKNSSKPVNIVVGALHRDGVKSILTETLSDLGFDTKNIKTINVFSKQDVKKSPTRSRSKASR